MYLASCALKVQRVYKNQNFLSRKKVTNAHVVKQKQESNVPLGIKNPCKIHT